jgi:hypothetical protein
MSQLRQDQRHESAGKRFFSLSYGQAASTLATLAVITLLTARQAGNEYYLFDFFQIMGPLEPYFSAPFAQFVFAAISIVLVMNILVSARGYRSLLLRVQRISFAVWLGLIPVTELFLTSDYNSNGEVVFNLLRMVSSLVFLLAMGTLVASGINSLMSKNQETTNARETYSRSGSSDLL